MVPKFQYLMKIINPQKLSKTQTRKPPRNYTKVYIYNHNKIAETMIISISLEQLEKKTYCIEKDENYHRLFVKNIATDRNLYTNGKNVKSSKRRVNTFQIFLITLKDNQFFFKQK